MNYGKRIALPRPSMTDSDSAICDDGEDESKMPRRSATKDKVNRNLSEKKRRDQFNMLVNELCSMVSTNNKKMDKSTVLKSTIAFLESYQETTVQAQVHEIKEDWKPSFLSNDEFMHLMLEALDSFLLVFTQQGTILYASESVISLLGHLPCDLVNQSIFDFIYKAECDSLHNMLYNYSITSGNGVPDYKKEENQLGFNCSFRRGSVNPNDTPVYERVTVRGSFRLWSGDPNILFEDDDGLTPSVSGMSAASSRDTVCFCSTVRLVSSQLVREMSLVDENKEFTSRHSLEWKFLFLDHRATPIIGYLPFEVLGTSGYDYYHPDDLEDVSKSHEQLMTTGTGTSCYYRFLTKGQQWIWLKTNSFITYHQWNSKPEFIVCTNTVVSYSNVRAHRRKEMGIDEGVPRTKPFCRSPSVTSVTSGGRIDSQWSLSPAPESAKTSDAESLDGSRPHSTSSVQRKMVSQQLQQCLQRHIQQQQQQQQLKQQQQQQQQQHQTITSFTSVPLQQLLQRRQAQQQSASQQQQQPQLILPRPTMHLAPTSTDLPRPTPQPALVTSDLPRLSAQPALTTAVLPQENRSPYTMTPSHSNAVSIIPAPSVMTISTSKGLSAMSPPASVFMTPVQRQLQEQLQRKARLVQEAIMRQQEELRTITEQLTFAQHGIIPSPLLNQQQDNTSSNPSSSQPVTLTDSLAGPPASLAVPMVTVSGQNPVLMSQAQFLPFPVLPNDAEILLSHTDEAESPGPPFNQQ